MAYSQAQWDKVKTLFELGYSLADIASKSEIKDRSLISRRSRAEGWEKGKNQQLVAKEVEAKQTLAFVDEEKSTKSPQERSLHDQAVSERLQIETFFRKANMLVAKTVASKVQRDGLQASHQELNAAASAISKTQESVLGKAPDVVINNTNAQQVNLPPPDAYAEIARELLSRV